MVKLPKQRHYEGDPDLHPGQDTDYWAEAMVFGAADSPVTIRRVDQVPTALHRHEFTEVVLITGGTGLHVVDDLLRYTLTPGDVFVIAGRRQHAYQDLQQLQVVNVLIRHRFMVANADAVRQLPNGGRLFGETFFRPRPLAADGLASCLRLVERLEQEVAGRAEGFTVMQNALLLELLVTVGRLTGARAATADRVRSRIDAVLAHLERHFAEPVALADLEAMAHMSPRSFQRHFQERVGLPPMQYLQRQRLLHACRLLRESDEPVRMIAAACGLPDTAYFCHLFHRQVGVTPGQFRRAGRVAMEP